MSPRRTAALLAGGLVLTTAACTAEIAQGPERLREGVFSYATAMPNGATLTLRNFAGSLTVEPSADDTLRVSSDLRWTGGETPPTDVRFTGDSIAGGVLVCAIIGESRCDSEDYQVKSSGGDFSIGRGGLKLGLGGRDRVKVHFRVQVPAGVKLDVVMLEGNVTSASTAPVKLVGVNGNITVVTSVGPVTVKTVNGNVDARMTTLAGTDSVRVESVNGNVYAFIPESADASADVSATNGTVLSDFSGLAAGSQRLSKKLTGNLGAGTTPVRVRTINGDAQLRRLDAQGRAYDLAPTPEG